MTAITPRTTFVGIQLLSNIGHSHRTFCYIGLDGSLKLVGIGTGTFEEVLAYAGGQVEAFVAVNAPRQPNMGLMRQETYRQKLELPPKTASWRDYRVVEFLLRQRRIPVLRTGSIREKCPPWMQDGFELFSQLDKLGFCAYPAENDLRQTLEVHPHAVFCALLGQAPFGRESLEGRLQRQLILNQKGVEVSDPMRFFEEVTPYKLLNGVLPLDEIYSFGAEFLPRYF